MNGNIICQQGDIITITTDAIVNAANSSLLGGGGVDGAIHRAGGPQILEECMAIRNRQGGCKTGEAVYTSGGNLPARYVIHTVGPVWNGGHKNEAALLANCYRNSLHIANELKLESIAFPNISTGIYHFPKAAAAKIAVETVRQFMQQDNQTLQTVLFVCFDDENFNYYNNLLMKEKNNRALRAEETVKIIEQGFYKINDQTFDIAAAVKAAINGSISYVPDGFTAVMTDADHQRETANYHTLISVVNCTVLEAASTMAANGQKVGCLNFASAKNPGGGFLGGAQAQEESLARASALYPTLTKHGDMYAYNKSRRTYLYSDYMIYSLQVPVFRNDADELVANYPLSIVTSPAVNVGAMVNNNPAELSQVETTMLQRMDKVLALFVHHGHTRLLLGAWGCGVFCNQPADVARWWAHYLLGNGKYARCFEEVVFAVFDRSKTQENITAFQQTFQP